MMIRCLMAAFVMVGIADVKAQQVLRYDTLSIFESIRYGNSYTFHGVSDVFYIEYDVGADQWQLRSELIGVFAPNTRDVPRLMKIVSVLSGVDIPKEIAKRGLTFRDPDLEFLFIQDYYMRIIEYNEGYIDWHNK